METTDGRVGIYAHWSQADQYLLMAVASARGAGIGDEAASLIAPVREALRVPRDEALGVLAPPAETRADASASFPQNNTSGAGGFDG